MEDNEVDGWVQATLALEQTLFISHVKRKKSKSELN